MFPGAVTQSQRLQRLFFLLLIVLSTYYVVGAEENVVRFCPPLPSLPRNVGGCIGVVQVLCNYAKGRWFLFLFIIIYLFLNFRKKKKKKKKKKNKEKKKKEERTKGRLAGFQALIRKDQNSLITASHSRPVIGSFYPAVCHMQIKPISVVLNISASHVGGLLNWHFFPGAVAIRCFGLSSLLLMASPIQVGDDGGGGHVPIVGSRLPTLCDREV